MTVAVLILSVLFVLILIGLSVRANARFRHEEKLPMQWYISRSKPLSKTVVWIAPRILALSFIPLLAVFVFALIAIGAMTLTPKPGQEGMLLPSVIFIGSVFVAGHVFYLWLVEKTLRSNDN